MEAGPPEEFDFNRLVLWFDLNLRGEIKEVDFS